MIVRKLTTFDGITRLLNLENFCSAQPKTVMTPDDEPILCTLVTMNSGEEHVLLMTIDEFYEHQVPH